MKKNPIPFALILLVIWATITLYGSIFLAGGKEVKLDEMVSSQPSYSIFLACFILLVYMFTRKLTTDVGFNSTLNAKHRIYIYPMVMISLLLVVVLWKGNVDAGTLLLVLGNTFVVGISEELMFRGILLNSFVQKYSYLQSILMVSLLFGSVHVLNGFVTGDFASSTLQAFMATFSGILFLAMRIKSINIIPAMIVHWLWDFVVFIFITFIPKEVKSEPLLIGVSLLFGITPIVFGILGIIECRKKDTAEAFMKQQLSN